MSDDAFEQLLAAYRATDYVVHPHALVGDVEHVLHVDERNAALDAQLSARGHHTWAFLTAWNPGSKERDDTENERDQSRLKAELEAGGWTHLRATGKARRGNWSEPSLFVPGLPLEEAERLGRAFGQVAIVVGRVGESASLVLCEDPRSHR